MQRIRLTQGHPLPLVPRLQAILQAPDLMTLPLVLTPTPPADAQMESAFFYFCRIHFLSLQGHLTRTDQWLLDHFQHRNDAVAHFADGLIAYLVTQTPLAASDERLPAHDLLRANLYRMTYSFWLFSGDFSKRLDFYDEDRTASTFGHLPELITQYFDLLEGDTVVFKPFVGLMRRLLYGIIRPDFPQLDADHQLCIAVLVEPGTFTLRDLLAFLDGVSFVKLATAQDDADPDVIITTLTSPNLIIDYYGPEHADVIQWQSTAAEEDYYRLYAELARRHHLKNLKQAQQ